VRPGNFSAIFFQFFPLHVSKASVRTSESKPVKEHKRAQKTRVSRDTRRKQPHLVNLHALEEQIIFFASPTT
jgi:hypothetical protein